MGKTKVFFAQRGGTCKRCGLAILPGQRITDDNGTYSHADCVWPDKVKTNTATGKTGAASVGGSAAAGTDSSPKDSPPPAAAEGTAERKRLRLAKKIVDEELPEAKDSIDYYAIVNETYRQLYGETWQGKGLV